MWSRSNGTPGDDVRKTGKKFSSITAGGAAVPQRPRNRRWIIIGAVVGLVLVVIALGVGLGVGLARRNAEADDNGSLSGGVPDVAVGTTRRLVVFGASYCDNGHSRPSKYSATLKAPPYYQGRESNGIVWDEYLAPLIGQGNVAADLRNYAFSGAMVDNTITAPSDKIPDSKAQMASYMSDLSSGLVSPLPNGGKTLIAIWIGINPLLDIWNTTIRGTTTVSPTSLSKAQSIMTSTTTALFSQINTLRSFLASNGTTADFFILPLPPTQLLPIAKFLAKNNPAFMNLFQQLTITYNAGIAHGLAGLANSTSSSVLSYDIPSLYTKMVANPSQAGVSDSTTACLIGKNECATPSTHMFWDTLHHTTGVHQYLAQQFASVITSFWATQAVA